MRCAVLLLALAAAGCGPSLKHELIDVAMRSAYRPPTLRPAKGSAFELLAGDFHCHVSPPDNSSHVARGLDETIELARKERLDFVVLTPHVASRFFLDEEGREEMIARQRGLRAELDRRDHGGVSFFVGFEYSDWQYGHAGTAFGDLEATLASVPVDAARADPGKFIERWIQSGGIVIINHPLLTPTAIQSWDLSWRPLTEEGPFPSDIDAVHRLAQGFEAYNVAVTHLRDRYLLREEEHSIRESIASFDREILRQKRRITPLGGSDSHSHHLRAPSFVLARGRSEAAIREAVINGRTCVRSPEACSLFARAPDGAVVGVGGAISADRIEVWLAAEPPRDAKRQSAEIVISGQGSVRARVREAQTIAVPKNECTLVRARVGAGFSGPIYVNCPFAGEHLATR
jgi:predicted metal-dependent phosphoesterase TrpH